MSREVPEGWTLQSLNGLIKLIPGWPFKSNRFTENPDKGRPLIRIRDLVKQAPAVFTPEDCDDRYSVNDGDYLIGMDGEFLAVKWQGPSAVLNQRVLKITSADECLDANFLFYRIQPALSDIEARTGATTVKHLSTKDLLSLNLGLPPLHEQRRIAEILSSVDEAIAATRAVIEQTRKVKQGVLERLLTKGIGHTRFKQTEIGEIPEGWEVHSFGTIFKLTSGKLKSVKGLAAAESDTAPYPAYGGNGVAGYSADYLIDGELIVIGRVGEYCGSIYKSSGKVWVTDNALYTKEILADVDLDFIAYAFSRVPAERIRGGGGQPLVSQAAIYRQTLALPSLDEQKAIVEILSCFDTSVSDLQFAKLVEIKSALMSDLLTGRKRVSDAVPMAAE
ncbi:restriction endonuclease subunit S [Hoeflea sp. AS16]|uniref:restriction endonuclease subunit S n=1 Tax=Hoeflea sp. AS16 TaxID=3135779 RepID=UPI003174A6C2